MYVLIYVCGFFVDVIIFVKMFVVKKVRVEEELLEIMGYIYNVFFIKLLRNNNKYFNVVFQDYEKYSDVVCFVLEYN